MLKILHRPSPVQYTPQLRWFLAIGIPLFIFVFLIVFRPFRLYEASRVDPTLAAGGFGLITFLFIFYMVFGWSKKMRDRLGDKWTIGYELTAILVSIMGIAISNHLFLSYVVFPDFYENYSSMKALFVSIGMTYAVGFIPLAFFLILYSTRAKDIEMHTYLNKDAASEEVLEEISVVSVLGQSKENSIELRSDSFLFAKASGNYVEFYSEENGIIQKELQRITLAKLESIFFSEAFPALKTHRGYIINTKKVLSYEGNAQGYSVYFGNNLEKVPVSRKLISDFDRVMNG